MNPLRPASLMLLTLISAASATEFYVAPDGRDTNAGARTSPFATIGRARDAIRQLRAASGPREPVTVFVRAGAYCLPETIRLESQDSGTSGAPVVYRAFEGEKPVLIGGRPIAGFQPHAGQILKADVASQGLKDVYFRQLLFDGKRQHLARYPNFDPANPYGGGWAYADGEPIPMYRDIPSESRRSLHYKTSDERRWARPQDGEVFVFPRYNWWNNIVRIASVDRDKRILTLTNDCSYPIRPGDRYYVRNLFEELDAPGEWYLDRATWTLYFWPPAPLGGKPVYAPTLRTLIELSGAAHVAFQGFTIECSEGTAVVLRNCTHCLIAANTIRNAGDYRGNGVAVEGGSHNGVIGNDIYEIGSDGITLSGGDRITLTPADNYADNNYIHHVGVFYKQGVGVYLRGCGTRASHNLIHDGPRWGIGFSGNNLVIESNHIRHVNLETADTGAVYTGGRDWISSRGTVIRHNFFHDILGYGLEDGKWVSPHYAWGVYLDDNTGGVDVVGNVVARAVRGLVHLHNARDNLIENNIFIDGTLQQFEANGWTPTHSYWTTHLPTMIRGYESVANQPAWKAMRHMDIHPTQAVLPSGLIMANNVFRRNIVYYHDPNAKLFQFRNVAFEKHESDYNLIYHFGQPLKTGQFRVGRETSSNLVANPGFEDGEPGKMPRAWSWQERPTTATQAAITEAASAEGKRSLRLEGATSKSPKGDTRYPAVVGAEIAAKPGGAYRLTARMKSDKPGAQVSLLAQSYVAKAYYWAEKSDVRVGPEWKPYEFAFHMPGSGEARFNPQMKTLRVRFDFRESTGALWLDDVSLKEAEPLSEWDSWKQLGFDSHSIVADPRFVAPEKDDYRLRPDSPAWQLGFKAIPFEKIGPYEDRLRATWPIVEAEGAREKPLVSAR